LAKGRSKRAYGSVVAIATVPLAPTELKLARDAAISIDDM
jgi:hypothetical protein